MDVATKVLAGAGLVIDAPFNPRPLRRVLERMGFASYGRCLAESHWRIWCLREGVASHRPMASADLNGATAWVEADGVHIDVRGLEAPTPLLAILRLIDSGAHGGVITVHHERDPLLLYPELAERGWTHTILAKAPGDVRLRLQREPA